MAAGTARSLLPELPGTYALILQAQRADLLRIGRRGEMPLCPGYYVYIGSALGPGGLRRRLERHLRTEKRPHWHIDYLRAATDVLAIWTLADPVRRECDWSAAIGRIPGAEIPLSGFGASDCRCPSHLFRFSSPPSFTTFCGGAAEIAPQGATPERFFPANSSSEKLV